MPEKSVPDIQILSADEDMREAIKSYSYWEVIVARYPCHSPNVLIYQSGFIEKSTTGY